MNKVMQFNVKGERAYHAATELSRLTGESLSAAVTTAVEERLDRERRRLTQAERFEALLELGRRYSALPESGLTEDEILDYDEDGVPRNRA